MSLQNYDKLIESAERIRTATEEASNTAQKVGQTFKDVIVSTKDSLNLLENVIDKKTDQTQHMQLDSEVKRVQFATMDKINSYDSSDLSIGYYYTLSQGVGGTASASPTSFGNDAWGCMRLEVKAGMIFTVFARGGANARAYAITDTYRTILEVAGEEYNIEGKYISIAIKEDGYLYLNCHYSVFSEFTVSHFWSRVLVLEKSIEEISGEVSFLQNLTKDLQKSVEYSTDDLISGFYNLSGGVGTIAPAYVSSYESNPELWGGMRIKVVPGSIVTISTKGGASARAYALTDNERRILMVAEPNSDITKNGIILKITQAGYVYVNSTPIYNEKFSVSVYTPVISELENRVVQLTEELIDKEEYTFTDLQYGYYYNLSSGVGGTAPQSPNYFSPENTWGCMRIKVRTGMEVTISTMGGSNGRAYAITNEERKILLLADANLSTINEPVKINIEQDGYLYLNCTPANRETFNLTVFFPIHKKIENLETRLSSMEVLDLDTPNYKNNPYPVYNDELRILSIGNSYTEDGTAYLNELVSAAGIDLSKCCLYVATIGGASLQSWINVYNDQSIVTISRRVGTLTMPIIQGTLKEILSQHWDVVTIQQVSGQSINYESYNPGIREMVHIIRRNCVNQRVCLAWHLVWGYAPFYGGEPYGEERWKRICSAVKEMVSKDGIDVIIPSGTAIENARNTTLNTAYSLTRDGTHLAYGVARYTAACTWFQTLFSPVFNVSVSGNSARHILSSGERENEYSADVTDENALLCQKCAFNACMRFYELLYEADE